VISSSQRPILDETQHSFEKAAIPLSDPPLIHALDRVAARIGRKFYTEATGLNPGLYFERLAINCHSNCMITMLVHYYYYYYYYYYY
jgi:hypothetical protein